VGLQAPASPRQRRPLGRASMTGVLVSCVEEGWSSARVALLENHYRAGLSAAESAILLGRVSKNAVISKRRRLGLFATIGPVGAPSSDALDGTVPRRARIGRTRLFRGPPPLPVEPLPDMDRPPPPDADPKPLASLAFGECVWPLGAAEQAGDYRTLFCGAPVAIPRCYCAIHAARAYTRRS
jgi:hypothetical protein